MAATTTVTMIPSTSFGSTVGNYDGSATSFQSDNTKGDGYYGFSDGVHTTQLRVTGFPGTVTFQGSLVISTILPETLFGSVQALLILLLGPLIQFF
mgnify:CR=1 FL=1